MADADTTDTDPDTDTDAAGGDMNCSRYFSLVWGYLPSIPPEKRWILIVIGMIIIAIQDTDLGITSALGLAIGSGILALS